MPKPPRVSYCAASFSATVSGEPTSHDVSAMYCASMALSGTDWSALRWVPKPKSHKSGSRYSFIMRPMWLPTDQRCASASVSATRTSRTMRQSLRSGVRPERAAPVSTESQCVAT